MLLRLLLMFAVLIGTASFGCPQVMGQNPFDPNAQGDSPFGDDNPFGGMGNSDGPDAVFGATPIPSAAADSTTAQQQDASEDPDPIVRLVRESPPSNPEEMAEAITWLTRIKRWDEIGRQLDSLAGWNVNQKAVLSRSAGAGLWIRLRREDVQLNEAQKSVVTEVIRAPGIVARNPQWIDGWIEKLGSRSAGERKYALIKLQDSGRAGVQRLVERIASGGGGVEPAILSEAILVFGEEGVDALKTACLITDPERAGNIFLAIASLPSDRFTAQLGAGLVSNKLSPDTVGTLANRIAERHGGLPSPEKISEFLGKEHKRLLREYTLARLESSALTVPVWQLTPDGQSIQAMDSPEDHIRLRRLNNVAMLMLQQQSSSRTESVQAAATLLQQSYQIRPELVLVESDQQVAAVVGELAQDASFWEEVFEEASEKQMHGAAIRALQMLGKNIPSAGIPLAFLSQTLKDPRPSVRYVGLETIAKADPREDFLGADLAVRTALEMTRLANGPYVLVIGAQSQIRQVAQQQLQQVTDANVTSVNTAREALVALQDELPVELVLIVDRVHDQSLMELLQRLRMSKRSASLPIAILTDDIYPSEQRLIKKTAGVVQSVLSRNPEQMGRVIEMMREELDTEMLSVVDRARFAIGGKKFLAHITKNSDQYPFYHVGDYRSQLVGVTSQMQFDSKAGMLAGVGNAASQMQLIEMAGALETGESERMSAAANFEDSLKRFGILLNREQVVGAYNLYNRLGPSDPVSVRVLGAILDSIEKRAGVR